jgi:hypothetical protein
MTQHQKSEPKYGIPMFINQMLKRKLIPPLRLVDPFCFHASTL